MGSISFQICSILYITILMFLFFTKKKIKTIENKIFSYIIVCNFIGLILDLLSIYTISHMDSIPFINLLVSKSYLLYLAIWITLFTVYIFFLAKNQNNSSEEEYRKHINKTKIISFSIILLIIILIGVSPLEFSNEKGQIYSYGLATTIIYIYSGICILFWIIYLIKNLQKINKFKLIPIIAYMMLGIIVIYIQSTNPSILLMSSMESFIVFLMYNTIENPDVKIIEQLNVAKEAAEKANSAKTDFLSNMSHEIRTPLNAIVGFSQSLLEEDISEDAKDEVKDIISASHSLLQIVNGILDISKIEANKLEIVNTEYNFEKIFDESVSLAKGRLGGKPLEFRYSYDSSIPPVLYGDYVRIKQIIVNLLTNAIKYTKTGYIDYKVSSVRKDDICRIIISVEDSGIGIKDEDIDKLFSKFQRFDTENNITIEGTGLGLAITKKLVELMNGKIVVQSKYGEGSKFTVAIDQRIIPKTLDDLTAQLVKTDGVPFVGNGEKILVVDDNNINLKVAKRLLESYNLSTELVSSGQECINKILDGNKYDMILLDDMMPKMSGVETLKNLKKILGFNIKTIALTANAITGMREKYLESGFDDYLAKPIDRSELEIVLRKYLINSAKENKEVNKTENAKNNNNDDSLNFLVENGVDIEKSLELLGDIETFIETLKDFKEESKTRIADIIKYKEASDMPNYAILVHAMKSDAKYLGLTKLAELSYNHEMASKEARVDYVNINFQELMDEVNKTLDLIDKFLSERGE